MKLIRELTENLNINDRQDPRGARPRPHHREDTRALLDAVAKAIPFVGYESVGTEEIKKSLNDAFRQVAGVDWHEWQKTGESEDI